MNKLEIEFYRNEIAQFEFERVLDVDIFQFAGNFETV